ncbi:hypothetical protein [Allorhizocola rhizosphaerae]|uniref:hypothetical protein n=1 Tax=Allorhizocola rhizosphaerae TaxID=1872709 RepID=UPI000E3CE59C|nr:hypothetical protein [Allorhizocola rhizosphaerae]
MSGDDLARRQAELVRALVAGGAAPEGFDAGRVAIARKALLRKRARNVRREWPCLAAQYGDGWEQVFSAWADGRPTQGALSDGYEFARANLPTDPGARVELMVYEARSRAFAVRIGQRALVVAVRGRAWLKLW